MIGASKYRLLSLELIKWILPHVELLAHIELIIDEHRYFIIFPGEEEVKLVPSVSLLPQIQVGL